MKNLSLLMLSAFVSQGFAGEGEQQVKTAQAPTLKINGSTSISVGGIKQKHKGTNGQDDRNHGISIGASDFYFKAEGQSSDGLRYMLRANINMIANKTPTADRNYIELGHDNFGTFQIGSLSGPEDTFHNSALQLMGGNGSIDGGLFGMFHKSSGVISGVRVLGSARRANKVVYATPEINGFQFGFGYTPNTSQRGNETMNNFNPNTTNGTSSGNGSDNALFPNKKNAAFGRKHMSFGASYKAAIDDFTLALSLIHARESSALTQGQNRVKVHDLSVFEYSAMLGYKDLKVAAGYIDNGKSRLPKGNVGTEELQGLNASTSGKAYNIGGQYTMGAYQFAVGYFTTNRKTSASEHASSEVLSLTADWKVLQGLKFFSEIDLVKTKTNQTEMARHLRATNVNAATPNNKGSAIYFGTKVSF